MDNIKRVVVVHSPNSTRAKKYSRVLKTINKITIEHSWLLEEIELLDVPYFNAVKLIAKKLRDDDLVIAAGGDGVAQATFNAVYNSRRDIIYTTVPLGNGNDLSRAFNGRYRQPQTILSQRVVDFYPLNVVVNNKIAIAVASYVTFGATTVLVDYLNNDDTRHIRRALKSLTPAASVPVNKFGSISNEINQLDFPDFTRDDKLMTDDSIGFFLVSAAHNVLRLPKDIRLASSEFFFHHATTNDKNLAQKVVMAGAWTVKFPGEMTELEELRFTSVSKSDIHIIANISGDNIDLGNVKTISALRSTRSVKVMYNNKNNNKH